MTIIREDITLSQTSYVDSPSELDFPSPDPEVEDLARRWQEMEAQGWEYLGNQDDVFRESNIPTNGFQAHAYLSPDNEIVIAIRGTDEIKDIDDDLILGLHGDPGQKDTAIEFANNIIENEGLPANIHVTGHSLGGYLAQEVVAHLNSPDSIYSGITSATGSGFNNPGMGKVDSDQDRFINIHENSDQVSHFGGDHLGNSLDLDGGVPFWRVLTAHYSSTLAETIIHYYPEIANMEVNEFTRLVQDEKVSNLSLEVQSEGSFLGVTSAQWEEINNNFALAEQVEQAGAGVSTILSAYEEGNDWDLFESASDLLSSIDKMATGNMPSYKKMMQDHSSSLQAMTSLVNVIGDIKDLEEDFSSGDGWGIADGTTSLLKNSIDAYDSLDVYDQNNFDEIDSSVGIATSAVGLGFNVKEFLDVLDDGDTTAKVQAALDVVESAISTYVAIAEVSTVATGVAVSASTNVMSSSLPAIGVAIGVAQGLVSILDGDAQGGSEQIALSVATYALCTIPVFGWAAALALQVASATRGCDGQIIDKENIEEFTDDLVPGATEAVQSAIASVEVAAEWLTKAYDSSSYFSGFNVEMYEDLGIEIPEEMHGELGVFQANFEANNPFRVAQYFQNLDELTLADVWDSTYITQSVAATIKQIESFPEYLRSTITDTPGIMADMVLSMANPDNLGDLVKKLFGNGDPPEASANFTIDESGNVVMAASGDSFMLEITEAYGNPMIAMMQYYRDNGGRLEIDGTLPSLKMVQGEDSQINYQSDSGGKITVLLDDMTQAYARMQGVLYARDRGDRLDSAVQVARDVHGDINFAKVDAIMAGHGFVKKGITYTFGETKQRTGYSVGSGVIRGGGNVGPEGKHFTARDTDITSLPLRTDQLPLQKLGDITKIVSLNNNFIGAGSELLAMSLGISSGVFGVASGVQGQDLVWEPNTHAVKPVESVELEKYFQSPNYEGLPLTKNDGTNVAGASWQSLFSELSDSAQMQQFLETHWSDMVRGYGPMPEMSAGSTYHYRELIGYNNLLSDGSRGPLLPGQQKDTFLEQQLQQDAKQHTTVTEPPVHAGKSFSGYRIMEGAVPENVDIAPLPPEMNQGPVFNMAEDSTLRFLQSELFTDTLPGGYSNDEQSNTFVSFDKVENGRIWMENNGDIRFEPVPGFVGTGYFTYSLMGPAGELIERRATVLVNNVNDLPLLMDDSFVLQEGEVLYLDRLLNNDTDPEGDTLMIDHLRGVEHGEISLSNNSLVFTPEQGYHGDVEFSYWVRDHITSYPVMANVGLTYLDVNNGPVPGDDRFIIVEDKTLSTSIDKLLANDVEHDGENFFFTGLGTAVHGSVSLEQNGVISFVPEKDYTGNDAGFHYNVEDDTGNSSSGWVAVEVLDSREAPVVTSTTREEILEDEILTFTPEEVAKFVYDADGDALHLDVISNVTGGKIVTENGYYSFMSDPDFFGRASFDYRANDNHRGTVEGHLEFEVVSVNDPIDTGDDQLATLEEQAVTTTVNALLANDTDVDGSVFTFVSLGAAAHGSVTVDNGGDITFIPDVDYSGDAAGFEYVVQDSEGLDSVGWVKIQVANVNDPPQIISNSLTLQEDQAIIFDAATLARFVKDADDDALTLTKVEAASGGTVTQDNGVYTFTPITDFNGGGSLNVTVTDGNGETVTSTLALDIVSQNDATRFGADELTTQEEQPVMTTVADLLANDSDVDGPLEFVALGTAFHGSVDMTTSGEITFVPAPDYFGNDAGFEYMVKDSGGGESTGQVSIRVVNVNDPPEIIANTLVSSEDLSIVFDAATISRFINDPDGDTITLSSVDSVTGGTISEAGGVYTFTPGQDYHGSGSLAFRATDGQGETVTGSLDIDILSKNDATFFGVDSFVTREEQPLVTTVAELLANDIDPDGDGQLEFAGLGETRHGQVRLAPDGTVEFMPDGDYFGVDAGFAYIVRDDEDTEATGWVTVKVENENDEPEILSNRLRIREDEPLVFTKEEVAKFITDADEELLHLDVVTNVHGGRIELNNGVYTFIPDRNFYGEASLDYLAKNNRGEEAAGQLGIDIIPINDLPETTYRAVNGLEDHEVTINVDTLMAGANDVEDGTQLVFDGIDSSLHGDVHIDQQGMVHFLPDKDFFGTGFFRYNVLDSEGGVGTGYVGVDVVGENDVPFAMDDDKILAWSNNSYENIYLAATFLANDVDVDFDPLQIISTGTAEHGTVSVDGAGNIHYIAPSDDWVGVDVFTYSISDGNDGFSEATAAIDVKINTSPDVYSELLFTQEDIISIITQRDLLSNDSDIDGDNLQITAVDQAEHCSVSLFGDGSISFTPELNYNNRYPGQASFRYTVSDGISDPVTGVAFFDIDPVNDKPILRGERISGAVEDNSFSFQMSQLMINDTDIEMSSSYEEDSIAFAGIWGAGHGSISFDANSGTVFYVPRENFCGVETFNYRVVDSHGADSVVQSEIYVKPVNDAPVVQEDIGHGAEDTIWNSYSISGLLRNDYDVDGDSLSIKNPYVMQGSANVNISGGNLMVQPATGEDRVVIGYTVTDGHGGDVGSRLTINDIREHNFAPEFSGLYRITKNYSYTDYYSSYNTTYHQVIFSFHVEDRNGGNSWGSMGDIVSIAAAQFHTDYQNADFKDYGQGHYGLSWVSSTGPYGGGNSYATFTFTARDRSNATGTIYVDFERMHRGVGPVYHYSPVVFDLDGDGVELLNRDAGVGFDWNLDGYLDSTGWVGRDDGFLVYDYDGDGIVTKANELALREYDSEATTDLEGLRAFDTNNDGVFDASDDEWEAFGVWQDKNSNGQTDDNEFSKLSELDITSVELESDGNYNEVEGNIVYGFTTYHKQDGSTGEVADVGLNGDTIEMILEDGVQGKDMSVEQEEKDDSAATSGSEELSEVIEVSADQEKSDEGLEDTDSPDNNAWDKEEIIDNEQSFGSIENEETSSDLCFPFDDAELNRQVSQLLSDISANVESEELPGSIPISDTDYHIDFSEPITDPEEGFPAMV